MFVRTFHGRAITYWNEGAVRLYGWQRSEAIGRQPAELLGSIYPIPLEEIESELERNGSWEGDIHQRHKDGHPITVRTRWGLQTDADGRPQAILEINSDVSRERTAIDDLSRSEQRFELLVSAVVDYAIFLLDPNGRIMSWNAGAQRIKGYTEEEILGRHFSIFYTPEDVENGRPAWVLKNAIENGRWEDEGWRLRKDGSRFWASVVVTMLKDRNGVLQGFAKVTRDITEKREAEARRAADAEREAEVLRAKAEHMAELERMKTEFLNLASHELRGPLAVVRGYNLMLRDGVLNEDDIPGISKIIEAKLAQMNLLVEQMLEAARVEAGYAVMNLTTFDLRDAVAEQVQTFRSVAGSHSINVVQPDRAVPISADRSRIGTVVANLLDNAIKYSPAANEIRVRVGKEDGHVFVAVRDFGSGIAPEHIPLLFQRFSRLPTDDNVTIPGTGLGLFLCQQIARRHGGAIELNSSSKKGSEFTLRLPGGTA